MMQFLEPAAGLTPRLQIRAEESAGSALTMQVPPRRANRRQSAHLRDPLSGQRGKGAAEATFARRGNVL